MPSPTAWPDPAITLRCRRSPAGYLIHERAEGLVAVPPAVRGRAGTHLRQPHPVVRQRDHILLDPGRGQVAVVDDQPTTPLDQRHRVAALLTVAVRERDVDRR